MTYPGFQAQQAAQQASTRASLDAARYAQQGAARATDLGFRSGRGGGVHYRPRRMGLFGLLGRLVAMIIMLVFMVVVCGVFLAVLHRADPQLAHGITSWLSGLF